MYIIVWCLKKKQSLKQTLNCEKNILNKPYKCILI